MREIRTYGSERAKAKWLRNSTNFIRPTLMGARSENRKWFSYFEKYILILLLDSSCEIG